MEAKHCFAIAVIFLWIPLGAGLVRLEITSLYSAP
jgi:hypothetical protein